MFNSLICHISSDCIDSNVSRLTVFFSVLLMVLFNITLKPIFIYLVAIDYFIRAWMNAKYSPVKRLAIINILNLQKKPIDLAQKIFASRLGFLCAFASSILISTNYPTVAISVAALLLVLSLLDSVFNFCVGCLIYNYIVYPFYKKANLMK
jgi:hypothetical protein